MCVVIRVILYTVYMLLHVKCSVYVVVCVILA